MYVCPILNSNLPVYIHCLCIQIYVTSLTCAGNFVLFDKNMFGIICYMQ